MLICSNHYMFKQDLFVAEEDDTSDTPDVGQYHDTHESAQDDVSSEALSFQEDPIVRSIPIVHAQTPLRPTQTLHMLQFPGRRKTASFEGHQLRAAVKPASKVLQVQTPMDTLRFYDESRALELGTRVDAVSLEGVLASAGGGLYAGRVVPSEDGPRLVVVPLDSSAQMRPLFRYIDESDVARTQAKAAEPAATDLGKPDAVQVLQTASKPSALMADGQNAGGVGSCLRHVKRFNEEDWQGLLWRGRDDSATVELDRALVSAPCAPVDTVSALAELM